MLVFSCWVSFFRGESLPKVKEVGIKRVERYPVPQETLLSRWMVFWGDLSKRVIDGQIMFQPLAITLSPIIIVQCETTPNERERTIGDTPIFH